MRVSYKNNILGLAMCLIALWFLPYFFVALLGVVLLIHHSAYEVVVLAILIDLMSLSATATPVTFFTSMSFFAIVFFFIGKMFRKMLF